MENSTMITQQFQLKSLHRVSATPDEGSFSRKLLCDYSAVTVQAWNAVRPTLSLFRQTDRQTNRRGVYRVKNTNNNEPAALSHNWGPHSYRKTDKRYNWIIELSIRQGCYTRPSWANPLPQRPSLHTQRRPLTETSCLSYTIPVTSLAS